jgi:uncharacterized protein YraI
MQLKHLMIAAAALAATVGASSAALARSGFATADVNMRAGPSTGFPVVTTIPDGARVNIHGCVAGYGWCDVGWGGARGWVSGAYLQFIYNDRRVLVPYYAPRIGLPIIAFSVDTYWRHHYRHRPWYHRRAYWRRHYHRQDRRIEHRQRRIEHRQHRIERRHNRVERRIERRHDRIERRQDRRHIRHDLRSRHRDRAITPHRSRARQHLRNTARPQIRHRQAVPRSQVHRSRSQARGGHRSGRSGGVRDY